MIQDYINSFPSVLKGFETTLPWDITRLLPKIIENIVIELDGDFVIKDGVAIHKTAIIEAGVVFKAPVIVSAGCFIGAHAYFRGGVFLDESVSIGPSCEIKSSILLSRSSVAHFNFIGDSIIGSKVNFEAGSITANHYNERQDKIISVLHNSKIIDTGVEKFGSLVGDNCKIGANAVLSPGTLLAKNSVVKRLELIEQLKLT